MPQPQRSGVRNRLLGALTPVDFARLAPALEPVPLPLGNVLIGAHQPIGHAHFVEQGIVSLVADTQDGRIEIGVVGHEGVVGTPLLLGTQRSPHAAVVQAEGTALRVPAAALREALDGSAAMRGVLGRYVQGLIVQVGQTVQASAELTVEGRLARWILMTHDRLDRDELPLTHEFLSIMLSVRRSGVTAAVHMLESAGMIVGKRGRITVRSREKLQDLTGGSYGLAEAEYERLLAEV